MSIYRLQPSAIRCPAPAGLPLLVHFVGRYFAEATPLKSLGNGSARPGQTEGIHRWCDPIERGAQSPFQAGTERRYGAGDEEMATSSLDVIDGVPQCPSRTT